MSLIHPWETQLKYVEDARKQFTQPLEASFPRTHGEIPKQLGNTVLRFVFWTHTEENYWDMTDALRGCNIVAVEALHGADQDEDIEEAQLFDEQMWSDINCRLMWLEQPGWDPGNNIVRYRFLCPDAERIYPLDVRPKHGQEYKVLKASEKDASDLFVQAVLNANGLSWSELREFAEYESSKKAATFEFREQIAVGQLKKIIQDNPGKTIGVVYGRGHVTLSRMIDDVDGLSLQRNVREQDEYDDLSDLDSVAIHSYREGIVAVHEDDGRIIEILAIQYGMHEEFLKNQYNFDVITTIADRLKVVMEHPINKYDPLFDQKHKDQQARVKGILAASLVLNV